MSSRLHAPIVVPPNCVVSYHCIAVCVCLCFFVLFFYRPQLRDLRCARRQSYIRSWLSCLTFNQALFSTRRLLRIIDDKALRNRPRNLAPPSHLTRPRTRYRSLHSPLYGCSVSATDNYLLYSSSSRHRASLSPCLSSGPPPPRSITSRRPRAVKHQGRDAAAAAAGCSTRRPHTRFPPAVCSMMAMPAATIPRHGTCPRRGGNRLAPTWYGTCCPHRMFPTATSRRLMPLSASMVPPAVQRLPALPTCLPMLALAPRPRRASCPLSHRATAPTCRLGGTSSTCCSPWWAWLRKGISSAWIVWMRDDDVSVCPLIVIPVVLGFPHSSVCVHLPDGSLGNLLIAMNNSFDSLFFYTLLYFLECLVNIVHHVAYLGTKWVVDGLIGYSLDRQVVITSI